MSVNTEMMPFKKFVQSSFKTVFNETDRRIKGTFKNIKTGEIIKGDNFIAHYIRESAEETYKAYLKWFNHTLEDGEYKREYVFAEWDLKIENGDK